MKHEVTLIITPTYVGRELADINILSVVIPQTAPLDMLDYIAGNLCGLEAWGENVPYGLEADEKYEVKGVLTNRPDPTTWWKFEPQSIRTLKD